jgi:hypothetical protein
LLSGVVAHDPLARALALAIADVQTLIQRPVVRLAASLEAARAARVSKLLSLTVRAIRPPVQHLSN